MCRSLGVLSTKRWPTWRAGSWASLQAACHCRQLCMGQAGELSVLLPCLTATADSGPARHCTVRPPCLQPLHRATCLVSTDERHSVSTPRNPSPPCSGPILLDKLICSPFVNTTRLDECNYSDEPSLATTDSHDYVRPGGLQTSRVNACATALAASHSLTENVPAHAPACKLVQGGVSCNTRLHLPSPPAAGCGAALLR